MTDAEDPIVIWAFETAQGGCRLNLQVAREKAQDLHSELWGCSVVAARFDEFISLAARAIQRAGGTLGDVLRQPVPTAPLAARIRGAAHVSDVFRARDYLIQAFNAAGEQEIVQLWNAETEAVLRAYIAGVATALDEFADEFVAHLAEASGESSEAVMVRLKLAISE